MTASTGTTPAPTAVPTRVDAVIFDCDGVIADSEGLTNEVLRGMLAELGWQLTREECLAEFAGHALIDRADVIEQHTGVRIDHDWIVRFRAGRDEALRAHLQPISGAAEAVRAAARRFPRGIALASGADRAKIELQLDMLGLADAFGAQVFSGLEQPRTKPAPDVYLSAMAALGVGPERTVVVEDTVAGVTAGVAAGARVWGYAPGDATHTPAERLLAAGAEVIITDMADLVASILDRG
ncbi:HAD family hydrolase [Microbacterium nymphoidis]|uniref:HAD family hydrolase n=1 Tax=Microbacterium nymphoidis TaxID=2898586 RepID=UPI001E2ADEFA|nr:HAD family phosphatase [Microbacterium nymphoidis]MCD2498879.1 HAD family phosphatase [Microbacterium nymphoidis]